MERLVERFRRHRGDAAVTVKKSHAVQWRCYTSGLLKEILSNPGTGILRQPLSIFGNLLGEVADRAAELNDPQLNALMMRLTLYEVADPASKEYDKAAVDRVIDFAQRQQLSGSHTAKPSKAKRASRASKIRQWKILARHRWVAGAVITESHQIDSVDSYRRFTATIRGYQNWRIWQGATANTDMKPRVEEIKRRVTAIRDRIDAKDESVFAEPGAW